MWKYICVAWFVWANTYVSFIFPFDFQNAHTRFVIFLANRTPLTYRESFLLRSCLSELPCKMFQTSWVKYSGKRAHCCIWARGCSEAAIWARGCSEAAWSRPAPCMAKKPKNPKSSPKLRRNAKFEPNAAKDPKMKQKWQTELTFKSWK